MKKLLVPTDFSDTALRAATYAAELATKSGALIYLVHVVEPPPAQIFEPVTLQDKFSGIVHSNRMGELTLFEQNIKAVYPNVQIEKELLDGSATDAITQYCMSRGIDLVIMGTRGASGAKEIFMGSTTSGVIGKSAVPVLAVPEEYALEEPDAILFATSHFEEKPELLSHITELARLFSAPVHVIVFVNKEDSREVDYVTNTRNLNKYMQFLTTHFPDITFHGELIEGTDLEGALQRYSIAHEVDVIGMVTYPKKFLERIFHRGDTMKMAFHSHIPVLAIPSETRRFTGSNV